MDLAVGVIIGGAFSTMTASLVEEIVLLREINKKLSNSNNNVK